MKNKAAQQLGRLGGSVSTEVKAAAARENGSKGGRPRKDEVLARTYGNAAKGAGPTSCCELVRNTRGKYLLSVDGRVTDARDELSLETAQEWYDKAAYQIGSRPEKA